MDGPTMMAAKTMEKGADQESYSRMNEDAAPTPQPGMTIDSINIRPSKNAGFTVSVSKSTVNKERGVGPMSYSASDYVFRSYDEVSAFLAEQFGGPAPAPVAVATGEPVV